MVDLIMWSDDPIKGKILHKLARRGKFEHSHTAFENLLHGFPADIRGKVRGLAEELVREGMLHVKKTNYGTQISLNLGRKERILSYIDEFLRMR